MELSKYLAACQTTEKVLEDQFERITHHLAGVIGESGEAVDMLKKTVIYGKPLDVPKFVKELGDICWYTAGLANTYELDGNQVAHYWSRAEPLGIDLASLDPFHRLRETLFISNMLTSGLANIEHMPDHDNRLALVGNAFSFIELIGQGWLNGFKMVDVFQTNIDKLAARYTEGYSDAAAQARADEAVAVVDDPARPE